jgi:hypothetical protein
MHQAMNAARFSPFLFAAILLGSSAHARPSADDKRNANALVLEGQRLLSAGDGPAALAKFQAAYAVMRAPTTGLNVAMAFEAMGKLVEARAMVNTIIRLPQKPDEPASFRQARATAAAAVEALNSRIPSLVLRIEGAPNKFLIAMVDGEKIPPESLTEPLPLNPGKREIVVTASGYQTARATVELVEGVQEPVEVPLVLARDPNAPSSEQEDGAAPARNNVLFYTGIALSGALAAVGVGTAIGAALAAQKRYDEWDQARCTAKPTPSCYSNFDQQENKRFLLGNTAAWTFIGAAAAGGGTLAYVLLTKTPADTASKQAFWISPTVGGVVVQGRF